MAITTWASFTRLVRAQGVRAATIASQGAALAQATSVIAALGAGRTTDALNLLYLLMTAPMAIIARGILLPYAMVRPSFGRWRGASLASGAIAALAVPVGALYLWSTTHYTSVDLWVLGITLSITGAALSASSIRAARLACEGRPMAIAALTIPTNVALSVAPWLPGMTPEWSLGLTAGVVSLAQLVLTLRIQLRSPAPEELARGTAPDRGQLASLSLSALSGYAGPTILQGMAATLPAGQLTLLGLLTKALGAIINLGIGAALLQKSNWASAASRPMERIATVSAYGTPITCAIAGLLFQHQQWRSIVVASLAWFGLACWAIISNRWLQLASHSTGLRYSAWFGVATQVSALGLFMANHTAAGYVFASAVPVAIGAGIAEAALRTSRWILAPAAIISLLLTLEVGQDVIGSALAALTATAGYAYIFARRRNA